MAINDFSQDIPAQQNFVWSTASSTSFFVSFPNTPDMDLILVGAELHQDIEEHDRLVLHFKGKPMLKRGAIVSNDPVVFSFTSGKINSIWHGYVHHITQGNTHQGGNTDIVCVGASSILKDTAQKVYTNTTYDKVVTSVGTSKGFEVIAQRHGQLKEVIVQTGESYWQLLKRMARVSGFALLVENMTIFFVSKDKIFQSKKKGASYFKYVDSEVTVVTTRELRMTGTILEFKPIISDQTPEMGVRIDRVISGIDKQTGTLIKSKHPNTGPLPSNPGVVIPNEEYFLS